METLSSSGRRVSINNDGFCLQSCIFGLLGMAGMQRRIGSCHRHRDCHRAAETVDDSTVIKQMDVIEIDRSRWMCNTG